MKRHCTICWRPRCIVALYQDDNRYIRCIDEHDCAEYRRCARQLDSFRDPRDGWFSEVGR